MVGWILSLMGLLLAAIAGASNITDIVFGKETDVFPAAFGDMNADELTDVVVLSRETDVVSVLLAHAKEPLLQAEASMRCSFPGMRVTSVVPGDFDGDAHMDLLVTTLNPNNMTLTNSHMLWGSGGTLNCTQEVWAVTRGQPLALDFDWDNVVDLFGVNPQGARTVWLSRPNRTNLAKPFGDDGPAATLRLPHSHGFLDLDGDSAPDLLLSTTTGFELHLGVVDSPGEFRLNETIPRPAAALIGQSAFVDLEQSGQLAHLLPVCADEACLNSTLLLYSQGSWRDLRPVLVDRQARAWGWVPPDGRRYTDAMTLRLGDFNMDGFCDLLATLQLPGGQQRQPFLLENVPCAAPGCVGRTFNVRWDELAAQAQGASAAAFYDVHQDGVLDVVLAGERASAFRNNLDYDANFVKVMVGGRQGNLPGPRVAYRTTTVEGTPVECVAAQLPQSAHFSLALPYVVFGLGRTPNFVDTLRVGVAGRWREWSQVIPNSQVQVFWTPRWRVRLFVTPSRLVVGSLLALGATCLLIGAIALVLHLGERRADRREKQAQAHRFHFDAM